jgi:hypothetical protein
MGNKVFVRGLLCVAISLAFGLQSLNYPMGDFSQAGPGLFPLALSATLFVIGIATIIESLFAERESLDLHFRNIALILGSIAGFAALSEFVGVFAGIACLVFGSTLAGSSYSISRNIKITASLALVAFAFQKLFHLNLALF